MTNTHQSVVTYKKENIHVQIKYMKASLRFFTLAGEGSDSTISYFQRKWSSFQIWGPRGYNPVGFWGVGNNSTQIKQPLKVKRQEQYRMGSQGRHFSDMGRETELSEGSWWWGDDKLSSTDANMHRCIPCKVMLWNTPMPWREQEWEKTLPSAQFLPPRKSAWGFRQLGDFAMPWGRSLSDWKTYSQVNQSYKIQAREELNIGTWLKQTDRRERILKQGGRWNHQDKPPFMNF